jgi:large subunit ribosomal protein L46
MLWRGQVHITNSAKAAERILVKAGGVNMNTWVVGNQPIGHYQYDYPTELRSTSNNPNELGFKTFFMKARIMAGQADLKDNKLGLSDFKWLAKEEVQKTVDGQYWRSVRNMLAER